MKTEVQRLAAAWSKKQFPPAPEEVKAALRTEFQRIMHIAWTQQDFDTFTHPLEVFAQIAEGNCHV